MRQNRAFYRVIDIYGEEKAEILTKKLAKPEGSVATIRLPTARRTSHMLIGEYKHNLDPKKRLAIPSKFRKELGEGAVLTKGLDGCLFIFPSKNWAPFAEMLGGLSIGKQDTRSFARLFLSGAVEVEFDSLGRILIPDNLKKYANFKKEVVIAGLFNRLEIWDEENWNKYKIDLEKNSDKIAEKLGELGLI